MLINYLRISIAALVVLSCNVLVIYSSTHSNVLVIGGAGLVGSHLLRHLHFNNYTMKAIDNFNIDHSVAIKRSRQRSLLADYNITIRSNSRDMCDTAKLRARLQENHYSHVILLAPPAPDITTELVTNNIRQQHLIKMKESFICLLNVLLDSKETWGTRYPSLIFSLPALSRPESFRSQQQKDEYASKLHLSLLQTAAEYYRKTGLKSVALQYPTVYGTGDYPDSVLYRLTDKVIRQMPIELGSEAMTQAQQFIHVDDVAHGILAILTSTIFGAPKIVKLQGFDDLTMYSLLETIAARAKRNVTIVEQVDRIEKKDTKQSESSRVSKQLASYMVSDVLKTVGYSPEVSSKYGVSQYVDWFKSEGSRLFPCASECAVGSMCFKSPWDNVAVISRQLSEGCTNVFYTVAIDDSVDGLHAIKKFYDDESLTCNIAFVSSTSPLVQRIVVDEARQQSGGQTSNAVGNRTPKSTYDYGNWKIILVEDLTTSEGFSDPRKPTRVPKLSPGRFFSSSVEHAIYMDSKLLLTCDPREFINMTAPSYPGNKNRRVAILAVRISEHKGGLFYHFDHVLQRVPERPSITFYEERLRQQKRAYREYEDRFDMKFLTLYDGAFLIHDLKTVVARDYRCDWYKEYQQWSDRDQVAATFTLTNRASLMHSKASKIKKNIIPLGSEPLQSDLNRKYGYGGSSAIKAAIAHAVSNNGAKVHSILSTGGMSELILNGNNSSKLASADKGQLKRSLADDAISNMRLLPRKEYHWDIDCAPGRIGRLAYFTWNRKDDYKYKHMDEIMAELQRQMLIKQIIRFASYLLIAGLAAILFNRLFRCWRSNSNTSATSETANASQSTSNRRMEAEESAASNNQNNNNPRKSARRSVSRAWHEQLI